VYQEERKRKGNEKKIKKEAITEKGACQRNPEGI